MKPFKSCPDSSSLICHGKTLTQDQGRAVHVHKMTQQSTDLDLLQNCDLTAQNRDSEQSLAPDL